MHGVRFSDSVVSIGRLKPCAGGIQLFKRGCMVGIERNPEILNRIANSDGVREFIHPDGAEMDLTPLTARITQTGVIPLSNGEDALALFELTAPRIYQSHTMFAKTCRGRRAIDTGREMVRWMFDHGADIVWGTTPHWNRAAIWFNRQIGAKPIGGDDQEEVYEIRREAYN